MSVIRDVLFPPRCIICDDRIRKIPTDSPFCEICRAKWEHGNCGFRGRKKRIGRASYVIGGAANGRFGTASYSVRYVPGDTDDLENRFILNLKKRQNLKASRFAAEEFYAMLEAIGEERSDAETVVTWIPRSREGMKKYGFDHMARVARRLAKMLGAKAKRYIKRKRGSEEQKLLSAAERIDNARKTLTISERVSLAGKRVILIDDITTTGASLDTAARLLLSIGAECIVTVTLARTGYL